MAELLELTVAEAAAKIAAGELSCEEYFEAWRGAAAGDELERLPLADRGRQRLRGRRTVR